MYSAQQRDGTLCTRPILFRLRWIYRRRCHKPGDDVDIAHRTTHTHGHVPHTSLNNPSELLPASAEYWQYRTQAYVTRVPVRQSSAMRDEKALKMSRKTWRVSECLLTRTKTCTERTEDARQKIDPYSRLSRHARRQYVTQYTLACQISLYYAEYLLR